MDFVLRNVDTEVSKLKQTFEAIATAKNEDGLVFHCEKVEELAHVHMNYPGYRITIDAHFGTLRDKIHVDLGVGDVVEPELLTIDLLHYREKPLFEGEIKLMVYPAETIFAEKLETVISRGAINSRMKDYHDLFLLTKHPELTDSKKLHKKIEATFKHRDTELTLPIQFDEAGMAKLQNLWVKHLRGLGDVVSSLELPQQMEQVIAAMNSFLLNH